MIETLPSLEEIWEALDEVKDPEIPVVSLVEMGIVRAVRVEGERVTVDMTPTFAGCPALHVMRQEVEARLRALGFPEVEVRMLISPPWSSDWITPPAREKLKAFGLAPPPRHGGSIRLELLETARCPYCDSDRTRIRNTFGPTLCRVIWYCDACQQPFEQFKPI
ncbi:MAG: phenylacetate-CoA oxygenase subunit PaaJ [Chloroflexi bacterium]|nr:phenylacetate-CoA oxygenase subunit PaaJ [Chloroflexota bacterium]